MPEAVPELEEDAEFEEYAKAYRESENKLHFNEEQPSEDSSPEGGSESSPLDSERDEASPSPEPSGETEPEKVAEPTQEEKEEPQTVPLSTFLEEKRNRKEFQQKLEEMAKEMQDLRQSLQPQEQIPSKDDDPLGYLEHGNKELKSSIDQINEKLEQNSQMQQAQAVQSHIQKLENTFQQQHEDYYDAIEYLQKARVNEYQMMGHDVEQATKLFQDEAAYVLRTALEGGRNPAEVAYGLAKARGFAAPAPQQNKAEESLKAVAKRKEAAQTLEGKGGRSSVADEFDVHEANQLDDDEFDKLFVGKDGDKRFQKLFQ